MEERYNDEISLVDIILPLVKEWKFIRNSFWVLTLIFIFLILIYTLKFNTNTNIFSLKYENYFNLTDLNIKSFQTYLKNNKINLFENLNVKDFSFNILNYTNEFFVIFVFKDKNLSLTNDLIKYGKEYYKNLVLFSILNRLYDDTKRNKNNLENIALSNKYILETKLNYLNDFKSKYFKNENNKTNIALLDQIIKLEKELIDISNTIEQYEYYYNQNIFYSSLFNKYKNFDFNFIIQKINEFDYFKNNQSKMTILTNYLHTINNQIQFNINNFELIKKDDIKEIVNVKEVSNKKILLDKIKIFIILYLISLFSIIIFIYLKLFYINLKKDIEKELKKNP